MRNHPNRDAPPGHPDRLALDKAEDICQCFDDARQDLGMSLRDIADASGMSAEYACRIMSRPGNMALTTIYRFAHALGLEVRISVKPKKEIK